MNMKKMFACMLLVVMVLSLVACGKRDDEPVSVTVTEEQTEDTTPTPTEEPEQVDTWYFDLTERLYGPEGFEFEFETYGWRIMRYNLKRCLIFNCYESCIYLADAETGTVECLSGDQLVIDYTVAYDTVYWFNLDREVWCSDWESEDYVARLYCEDAIAVSPHTDESEGAIVSPDRANWEGYGLPIYSPYGM